MIDRKTEVICSNQPLISVIIPVYNTEPYISRCLDSVLNNDYQNLEILCVNDGSTDRSLAVLNQFSERDKRIKVFDADHKGAASARNFGLNSATGQYIAFIDSDDWVSPLYFEALLDAAVHNGIGICGYKKTKSEEKPAVSLPLNQVSVKTEDLYFDQLVDTVVLWGKLFHKDCFQNLRFPDGKVYEDEFVTYKLLFEYEAITMIDEPLYYYFDNPVGVMNAKWSPKELDKLDAIKEQILYFKERSLKKAYTRAIAYYYSTTRSFLKQAKKAQYKKEAHILKKLIIEHVFRYGFRLLQYRLQKRKFRILENETRLLDNGT